MTPSHTLKKGVRYRYYVSVAIVQGRKGEAGVVARVPAPDIEQAIVAALRDRIEAASCDDPVTVRHTLDRIDLRVVLRSAHAELSWIEPGHNGRGERFHCRTCVGRRGPNPILAGMTSSVAALSCPSRSTRTSAGAKSSCQPMRSRSGRSAPASSTTWCSRLRRVGLARADRCRSDRIQHRDAGATDRTDGAHDRVVGVSGSHTCPSNPAGQPSSRHQRASPSSTHRRAGTSSGRRSVSSGRPDRSGTQFARGCSPRAAPAWAGTFGNATNHARDGSRDGAYSRTKTPTCRPETRTGFPKSRRSRAYPANPRSKAVSIDWVVVEAVTTNLSRMRAFPVCRQRQRILR